MPFKNLEDGKNNEQIELNEEKCIGCWQNPNETKFGFIKQNFISLNHRKQIGKQRGNQGREYYVKWKQIKFTKQNFP